MAGFGGRNHRGGKRSSSSSSYCSIVTVVVFLAFCLLGLWLLTSSYVLPSRVLSNRTQSRQNRVTKPTTSESNSDLNSVAFDDNSGDLAGEGKVDLRREEEESGKETGSSGSGGAEEEQQKNEEKENEIRQGSEEQQVVTEKEVEVEGQKTENEGGDEKRDSEDEDSKLELVTEKEKESKSESEKQEEKNSESEGEKAEESESEKQTETEEKSLELSKVQTEVELDGGEQQEQEQQNSMQEESSENKEQNEQQNEEKVEKDSSESTIETGERVEHRESKEELQSDGDGSSAEVGSIVEQNWELCNVTAGPDYIPCLDNEKALKTVRNTGHYEHRERHCPEEGPKCLVPLPSGYRHPIEWPRSRDKIWYNNVPRTKLAEVKGHQNWVKVTGEFLTFPGGGTQFIHGALHYIDFIQKAVPRIAWGKHTRVILDVGCGVASFGGYLFDRDVIAMSFAPKDEHEAQVQFALERGIPAISAVMGTQRLPFPSKVFDIVHCARCRVPWHLDGGALLLELNRVLRPGGYFVWSATPVYQKLEEDVQIWKAMSALTISMCWDLVTIKKDRINSVGAAVYRKPVSNDCYDNRKIQEPPMCKEDDDPNVAWYFSLQACMHRVPTHSNERGTKWPVDWPRRLEVPPYWLNNEAGVYGQPANKDFTTDLEHWRKVVQNSYLVGMDIDWSKIRNVMDMRAVYGGFAAALKDKNVWVMNVVNVDSHDTLPIIFERGLFGMYHDWCESFSTYPRTYDLLHADHLLSGLKKRCEILPVIVEVDRILRPGGKLIVRDEPATVSEVEKMLKSLHWEVRLTFTKGEEGILCAEKTEWRPETFASSS